MNKKPELIFDSSKQYYFVDASHGNDKNSGTKEQPWKSLFKANTVRAQKRGTTIVFRKGIYKGTLEPHNNGQKHAWLTFKAYPGEKVLIDGANSIKPCVNLLGKSYITIEDFNISNSKSDGVAMEAKNGQHHLVVSNCSISNVGGSGVRLKYASYIDILNNRINHTGDYGIADKGGSSFVLIGGNDVSFPGIDCIYIASTNFRIDNNYLHDNSKPVDPHEHADGIQVFLDSDDYYKQGLFKSNIIISNNTIALNVPPNNGTIQSNSMMLENAEGMEVFNNIVLGRKTSNVIDVKNCPRSIIYNNTLIDSRHQGIYINKNSKGCHVFNNLVYGSTGQSLLITDDSTRGFLSDYNIFSSPIKWGSSIVSLQDYSGATGMDKHSLYIRYAPGIIDYGKSFSNSGSKIPTYRLIKSSPAVDKGFPNENDLFRYPKKDKEGSQRCVNGVIDIGACEFTPGK
jgi:parallel beta-helix repeat protein